MLVHSPAGMAASHLERGVFGDLAEELRTRQAIRIGRHLNIHATSGAPFGTSQHGHVISGKTVIVAGK